MSILAFLGLPVEVEHGCSYFAAVLAAMLLVPCLTILLTAIDSEPEVNDSNLTDIKPDAASEAKTETVEAPISTQTILSPATRRKSCGKYVFTGLFFVSSTIVAFLFLAEFTNWNKIVVSGASVLGAVLVGSVATAGYHTLFSQHSWPKSSRVSVTALKEAFTITGIIFALYSGKTAVVAMTRGANSNAAAVQGQLSQSEGRIDVEEEQDSVLTTMYYAPSWNDLSDWKKNIGAEQKAKESDHANLLNVFSEKKEEDSDADKESIENFQKDIGKYAESYWEARLATTAAAGLQSTKLDVTEQDIFAFAEGEHCSSVDTLTDFIFGAGARTLIREKRFLPEIRTAFTKIEVHTILIFNQLHMIVDYINDKVIRKSELDAWIGYSEDLGPHPVILATLCNWLDKRYCTREFFVEIRLRLSGRNSLCQLLTEISKASPKKRSSCSELIKQLDDSQEGKIRDDFYKEAALLFQTNLSKKDLNRGYDKLLWLKVWETYMVKSPGYHDLVNNLPLHDSP